MAAMSVHHHNGALWDSVMESTKSAQERNGDPMAWAAQLSSSLGSAGLDLPSPELAQLLVSHICWANHVPVAWKLLEKALAVKIVPPMVVLALLSVRVIPNRQLHPTAYRLYMELVKRHAFSFTSQINGPNFDKIMKSVDDTLHLSQLYGIQVCEPGVLLVEYLLSIVWQLLDASLDDEGLLELTSEKKSRWAMRPQDMEIDVEECFSEKRSDNEAVLKANATMAVEIVVDCLKNKTTSRILCLARRNMPSHWACFNQRLQLLATNSSVLRSLNHVSPESLLQLTSDPRRLLSREDKRISQHGFHAVLNSKTAPSSTFQNHKASFSSIWLPIDLFLEDAMDGSQITSNSAVDTLIGLLKALQAVNGTPWHDTFLGLWMSALRQVQRERNPREGPVPRLDTCLCMLLSISTLAVTEIVEEEDIEMMENSEQLSTNQRVETQGLGQRRRDLVTSLQLLGDYEGLLTPPQGVSSAANQAAVKAMMVISGLTVGNGYYEGSVNDMQLNCVGNMRHLIVEACIARKVLDTSAYFWPGYVNSCSNQLSRNMSAPVTGWSSLMKGSPLSPALVNALIATPASSLAEIEKIYEIAISGSDDEKISAANILCGATLVRGWSVQENVCLFIITLLGPRIPAEHSGNESHLITYAALFNALMVGISSIDCVQIFSLHGLIPHLAAALMPICEVFGSSVPNMSWTTSTGEEISCHAVFSNAFTLLLKSWRYDHPPLEHVMGDVQPSVGSASPEYILLVRNRRLASVDSIKDKMKGLRISKHVNLSVEPVLMESFPRLKLWYQQHQKCISSTLSGLEMETPVHHIVDALLSMMFRKINKGNNQTITPTNSGSSTSSLSVAEESSIRLKVPAWDVLEATPYVLDAALTACAHGRLFPRDLATGLKELADYLPATLATIVSYFSAEVTRGIWKPASMNGTDWPSPAANLSNVEQQIKNILAATGVDVPSLQVGGSSSTTLPLPLAALISLTITYKLDKASERALQLIGPAVYSLATCCPWPCMPIIASLWVQKVKRWSDFLVFSASQAVFHHNSDAVVQLLRSCFAATLGFGPSQIHRNGGVGSLLSQGFGTFTAGISPVSPGFLYLRVHRSVRNVVLLTEEIVALLMFFVREIASSEVPRNNKAEKLTKKMKFGARYGQVSFSAAMSRIKLAASLGASLVWITGGPTAVHSLIKETLPSWFISSPGSDRDGRESTGTVAVLRGYALAYFAILSGTFAWGIDSADTVASRRRPKILGAHLDFVSSALDGKISLGCDRATWRAYVSGLVSLMVGCTQKWVTEIDVDVLKRLSKGLRLWDEDELALAVLGLGGVGSMGAAAELIIESRF